MNALVVTNKIFHRRGDGSIVSEGTLGYSFWRRYLDVFDRVRVLARVADDPLAEGEVVEGPSVMLEPLPAFRGPSGFIPKAVAIGKRVAALSLGQEAVILRGCGPIHGAVLRRLHRERRPYAVEVVADPAAILSKGGARVPLRPLFRAWLRRQLADACRHAAACAYVTEEHLQAIYPPAPHAFTAQLSSIELDPTDFKAPHQTTRLGRLVSAGTMDHDYKGFDILIEAVAAVREKGLDLRLRLYGGGRRLAAYRRLAAKRGIAPLVDFRGAVPRQEVLRGMDQADLFVLASRSEGTPRVLIESMARGLPCLGARVGGIPELLADEDLFPPEDPPALADRLVRIASERTRLRRMAERQHGIAARFAGPIVRSRRKEFYRHLEQCTS